ncbi:MAG: alpha/beta hydrolase family protein [Acidiferrobacteraceae bacterium]
MSDTPIGINAENAGLFSAAAYTPIGQAVNLDLYPLPTGWSEWTGIDPTQPLNYPKYSDTVVNSSTGAVITPGNNEFRVFINPTDHQIVIAFKGTSTSANWASDLTPSDEGATQYNDIMNQAQAVYDQLKGNSKYSSYHFFTDGHSLGGEMAQAFALKNGLSGFGQNSLPIAQTIQNNAGQGLRRARPEPHARTGRGHGGATRGGEDHQGAKCPDADQRRRRCSGAALWISPDRNRSALKHWREDAGRVFRHQDGTPHPDR